MRRVDRWAVVLMAGGLLAPARAQEPTPRQAQLLQSVRWTDGPAVGPLGTVATVKLPAGYRLTDGPGVRALQEAGGEPPSADAVGAVFPPDGGAKWEVLFSFRAVGRVPDDEKDALDADALLAAIRAGTEEANRYRVRAGGKPLTVVGWERPPEYHPGTRRLSWALRARDADGDLINYNTRLLGRGGVRSANLIGPAADIPSALPKYFDLLDGFGFVIGQNYAEWRPGDKVAEHGLTALVAGTTVAVAAKTGLLGKLTALLAKAWKPIAVAVAAVAAALGGLVRRLGSSAPPAYFPPVAAGPPAAAGEPPPPAPVPPPPPDPASPPSVPPSAGGPG